ncbi:MAG: hypothetical protein QOJ19_519, partial [Acidimicrobiia bacterium]|nr:hypothetical protein [Acidimicrobiia bacterium]
MGTPGVAAPPSTAPTQLRVRVLGGFGIEGLEERAVGTRKARVLLKRLALEQGRPVPGEELAAAVWGDDQPSKPNDQVSVLVSRLRAVLGPERLPRTDAGYCLAADWFDLAELDARTAEVEARLHAGEVSSALAAGQAALALARGALLPEEDAEWVDAARPAVDRLVARARLAAAEAALAVRELAAARAAGQAVLDHDPYDEAALRLVMRADAFAGRPGAALASYAAVRRRLAEDLGVSPAAETEELHTAIVCGELPALGEPAPVARTVVGRGAQHAVLDALLQRAAGGESVVAVIEAEAGMGKSALLSSWTEQVGANALTLIGRCDELGRSLPLQPVIDGLAGHLDSIGRRAASDLLGEDAAILNPLLGRPVAERAAAATTVADVDTGRAVLFGALSSVLSRAAGERPLVVVVDDLHQAAAGTAEFLAFAARRLARLMVVAARRNEPGPDLHDATRITLAPLTVDDAVAMVGRERGPVLHERCGGHPLFLRELAAAPTDDELPESIVAAVRAQLVRLGGAAASLEAAACCGTEVDVELVAAITERPVVAVLDDLEAAAGAGLLRPSGSALRFAHELVRVAVEAATSPLRRTAVHRVAVLHLAARSETDPLALARHARLGGDPGVAAGSLVAAAARSADRFEVSAAEELLDEAIELFDTPSPRLARGRLRLGKLDVEGAREDAARAIDLGAGVDGFELAGWVEYYSRDYDTALQYADEGVERSAGPELRASCLALSGRIRHTRGQLSDAATRLQEGVAIAPPHIRGMLQVWYAQVLAHRGETDMAIDTARRGVLDPHVPHPFSVGHGWFTLSYALALSGRWSAALAAVDDLDQLVARKGDKRFPPVAANVRGWLIRGIGQLEQASELHRFAAEAPGPTFQEAHYAAILDLTECQLAAHGVEAAAAVLEGCADIMDWRGSMAWRHRNRYRLLVDRLSSMSGDHSTAASDACAVADAAAGRGDRRYHARAMLVAAAAEARAGHRPEIETVGRLIDGYVPLAGPDGWRDLAEAAFALGSEEV